MTKEKNVKNRKKYYPNKENASKKFRAPEKSMEQKLKELQAHINGNYHTP